MTYSSSMAVSRHRLTNTNSTRQDYKSKPWGKNLNTASFSDNSRKFGPVSNTIMLIILVCILGLLYLTQVTKTNAFGYKINSLKKQQAALKQEQSELEVSAARLQSLDRVANNDSTKNMVSVAPSSTIRN